jgi:hypothetical protein
VTDCEVLVIKRNSQASAQRMSATTKVLTMAGGGTCPAGDDTGALIERTA